MIAGIMGTLDYALNSLIRWIAKKLRRKAIGRRLQREAAARPETELVQTPAGEFWMSPIEAKLYEAMSQEGLLPIPQHCVEGYFVDFAFPREKLAVEADGADYHQGARRQRDRKRDWILRTRYGWEILRFKGSTIHQKVGNCVYVVKRRLAER